MKKLLQNKIFIFIFIIVLAVLCYSNSFHASFQFDDEGFIVNNERIFELDDGKSIFNAYRGKYATRFVTFLTFAINYHFHKLDVFGYHVVNLLIHIFNSFLLIWMLTQLLNTPFLKEKYKDSIIPIIVSTIFLVHPLQTQSVTYISQRFVSLATMFYLLTLCFYIKGRVCGNKIFYFGCLISAFVGVFTKEIFFTLPLIIVVMEYLFFKKPSYEKKEKDGLNKFVLYGLALIVLIIPLVFKFNIGHILFRKLPSGSHSGDVITMGPYLLTQFKVIVTYIKLLVFPVGLTFDYDFPLSYTFFDMHTAFSFVFLILLLTFSFYYVKKNALVSFGLFWFFITLSVESSIIPIPHVIFEHRTYLPSIGFILFITIILDEIFKSRNLKLIAFLIITLSFSCLTFERNKVYLTEVAFWKDAVKKAPLKSRPYDNLGSAYLGEGKIERAEEYLLKAIELGSENVETYNNLGGVYRLKGQYEKTMEFYNKGLSVDPGNPVILNNMGVSYREHNEDQKAREMFLQAIHSGTGYVQPAKNLSLLYEKMGEFEKAIEINQLIIKNYSHEYAIFNHQLDILFKVNDRKRAQELGLLILKTVSDADTLTKTGVLFAMNNEDELAIRCFEKSIKIDPNHIDTYIEAGKFMGNKNEIKSAIAMWQQALTLDQNNKEVLALIEQAQGLLN